MLYLNKFKYKDIVPLLCPHCNVQFTKNKHYIHNKFNKSNCQNKIFCSRTCSNLAQITKQNVLCLQCLVTFEKQLNQIKKFPNHFCSHSCSATYTNLHKTTGARRSKLECWIEKQLTILYPHLIIYFNRKETIDSELDIHIPLLKLAFELNGIFHYEPIYGEEKFLQIKNNDYKKIQECLTHNIELIIIDSSKQNPFKEKTSKEYLDKIINIINSKISI